MKPRLPIGISSFRKIREEGCFFADKSEFVRLVLDASAEVILLPRPRRFGKTLGISMLKCFLDRTEPDAARLFEGLAISDDPESMARLGRFPVVSLSLKGIRGTSWEVAYRSLSAKISDECRRYPELAEDLVGPERERFRALCAAEAEEAVLRNSLMYLVTWLHRCHGARVVVLIDEYDTPIHEAYRYGYYEDAVTFFRTWLGEGLKLENGADALEKAVVTGIMRVAKESLFSGLNNFDVFPSHKPGAFGKCFGFVEDDVEQLLAQNGLQSQMPVIRDWYNGYALGDATVYNPWSVLQFANRHPAPPRYLLGQHQLERSGRGCAGVRRPGGAGAVASVAGWGRAAPATDGRGGAARGHSC